MQSGRYGLAQKCIYHSLSITMNAPDTDFHLQLAILKKEYISSLDPHYKFINQLWESRIIESKNHDLLNQLLFDFHKLAGSGATFGFNEITEISRALEHLCQQIIHLNRNISANDAAKFRKLLDTLKYIIDNSSNKNNKNTPKINTLLRTEPNDITDEIGVLIYVLDNSESIENETQEKLHSFGYHIKNFLTIDNLVTAISAKAPNIVILDNEFSNRNFLQRILSLQKNNEYKIILLSPDNNFSRRLNAVRLGFCDFLVKPFDVFSLVEKLDLHISTKDDNNYRILIVDDSEELSRFYSIVLQQHGMQTRIVNDPLLLTRILGEFHPELILMDLYMPDCTGIELAKIIRQQPSYISIPIVFLSSETNLNTQLDAMSVGGDDFLTKPIDSKHLVSSISIRAQRHRYLRSFMVRDSLTGLYNHTRIKELLEQELERAKRNKLSLVFAMIDIDYFKSVNDTYGHPTGDKVIKNLARLLQLNLRKTDIIGRYGGEEFAVILLDSNIKNAVKTIKKIRNLQEKIIHQYENTKFNVTFSCGVSCYPDFTDTYTICNEADKALYHAKNNGKNSIVSNEDGMYLKTN